MLEPLQHVLPQDNGQVRCHHVLCCSGGPNDSRVEGQPAARVLLGLVLVDVGDLEVGGPLDGPKTWSKREDPARVFLLVFVRSVPRRGAGSESSRLTPTQATSQGRSRLNLGGVTSGRDAVIPAILLPAPYLTFVLSVA